jgi:hypothetical protein
MKRYTSRLNRLRGGQLFFSCSQLTEVYSDDLRLCLWLMSLSSDCYNN